MVICTPKRIVSSPPWRIGRLRGEWKWEKMPATVIIKILLRLTTKLETPVALLSQI
jgi:hypothetical protein